MLLVGVKMGKKYLPKYIEKSYFLFYFCSNFVLFGPNFGVLFNRTRGCTTTVNAPRVKSMQELCSVGKPNAMILRD